MTKVVINCCYGGFCLSQRAIDRYNELTGKSIEDYIDIARDDRVLVQVVEELGDDASDSLAELVVRDIPKGSKYRITEYDGYERIEINDNIEWLIA